MPKLAANVSLLFPEHDFLDRFAAAAEAGFKGVEFLFPYEWPIEAIAERLEASGLTQVLFNLPPGDFEAGERGFGAIPGREDDFREGLEIALDYAEALSCPHLHVMAGKVPTGAEGADLAEMERLVSFAPGRGRILEHAAAVIPGGRGVGGAVDDVVVAVAAELLRADLGEFPSRAVRGFSIPQRVAHPGASLLEILTEPVLVPEAVHAVLFDD